MNPEHDSISTSTGRRIVCYAAALTLAVGTPIVETKTAATKGLILQQSSTDLICPTPPAIASAAKSDEVAREFDRLSKQWKSAQGPQSSITRIVTHPAYLEIISYGEKMIPHVLRDLEREPNHWFIALKAMAKNFSPVKPEDAGNVKKMTAAWLDWGRKNGKLS